MMAKKIGLVVFSFLLFVWATFDLDAGYLQGKETAMTIGDRTVSVAMFDFFYYTAAYQQYNNLNQSGMADQYLDFTVSLKEQQSPYGRLWSEVLYEETLLALSRYVPLYTEALTLGYVLDEEELASVDSSVANLETNAATGGVSVQDLLRSGYGPHMTEAVYRECLEMMTLAARRAKDIIDEYTFTEDDYEEAYQSEPEQYDLIDFRFFSLSSTLPAGEDGEEPTQEEQDAYYAAQKAKAEALLAAVTTSESFFALTLPYRGEDAAESEAGEDDTMVTTTVSTLTAAESEFFMDESRKPGDKFMLEENGYFSVFLFVDRYREEKSVNVRHILIGFDQEAADAEADKKAKLQEAESILQRWKDGEATEAGFTALVEAHSTDTASVPDGGLYSDITAMTGFVKPFLAWCMEERQPGDTGIVETTHGYHIMYFSGFNEAPWRTRAETLMENERFGVYTDLLAVEMPAVENPDGIAKAMGDLVSIS